MTRVLGVLIHNWPLKLAAIGLATLLYGGLVLSQSSASLTDDIPVDVRNYPENTFLLSAIRSVTEVRYFSPTGVQPIASDFEAWIDLRDVTPGGGPQSISVRVRSVDPRITVTGHQPDVVTIDLDRIDRRTVPVRVERGNAPANLELGKVTIDPLEVEVIGPASVIARVVAARADVIIQPLGIDIDQDVQLVPVDAVGDVVAQVRLEPATARVTIPIFTDRQSKTLTISPVITGSPASGFELVAASVEPPAITIAGDIDDLAPLLSIETAPISITGFSSSQTIEAALALPTGVVALDDGPVVVSIVVRPVTATRSFEVGMRLIGARAGLAYTAAVDRVLITVGGGVVELDRLVGATMTVELDVTALGPGTTDVPVVVDLPPGVTLVASSPTEVAVTVTATASPSPAPAASPGG